MNNPKRTNGQNDLVRAMNGTTNKLNNHIVKKNQNGQCAVQPIH